MKRLFLLIALAATMLAANAELQQNAFVVYCNDGSRHGFLFDEITKICYSRTGMDGREHEDFVTHEIHTADSIYRFGVETVDSVSFERPQLQLQPNVVRGEECGLFNYLTDVNGLTLTFSSSIPESLKPRAGQVITNFDPTLTPFNDVFAAKVVNVYNSGGSVIAECDLCDDITDVYARLYGVEVIDGSGPAYIRDEAGLRRVGPNPNDGQARAAGEGETTIPYNFTIGGEYEWKAKKVNLAANFGVQGELTARVVLDIDYDHQFMSVFFDNQFQPSINFSASRRIDEENENDPLKYKSTWGCDAFNEPRIQIVSGTVPLLNITFAAGAGIYWQGQYELACSVMLPKRRFRSFCYYNDGLRKSSKTEVSSSDADANGFSIDGSFSVKGTIHAGLLMASYIGTTKAFKSGIGFYSDILVGPRFSGEAGINLSTEGSNLYRTLHNTKVELSPAAAEIDISFIKSFYQDVPDKYQIVSATFPGSTWTVPLVPDTHWVTNAQLDINWHEDIDETNVFGKEHNYLRVYYKQPTTPTLLPVRFGVALVDPSNRISAVSFAEHPYWSLTNTSFNGLYETRFYGQSVEKGWRVRPIMSALGFQFLTDDSGLSYYVNDYIGVQNATYAPGAITDYGPRLYMTGKVSEDIARSPGLQKVGFLVTKNPNAFTSGNYEEVTYYEGVADGYTFTFTADFIPDPNAYYYIRAVADYGNYQHVSDTYTVTTGDYIYRGIDFHLPSGNIWSRVTVGNGPNGYSDGARKYPFRGWGSEEYYAMVAQGWRIPTKADFEELVANTNWDYSTNVHMDCYPIGGGEGRAFLNGHHWTEEEVYEPIYDEDGNQTGTRHYVHTLYTNPPYAYPSSIDMDNNPFDAEGYIIMVR